jgi:hypothetical protein
MINKYEIPEFILFFVRNKYYLLSKNYLIYNRIKKINYDQVKSIWIFNSASNHRDGFALKLGILLLLMLSSEIFA